MRWVHAHARIIYRTRPRTYALGYARAHMHPHTRIRTRARYKYISRREGSLRTQLVSERGCFLSPFSSVRRSDSVQRCAVLLPIIQEAVFAQCVYHAANCTRRVDVTSPDPVIENESTLPKIDFKHSRWTNRAFYHPQGLSVCLLSSRQGFMTPTTLPMSPQSCCKVEV